MLTRSFAPNRERLYLHGQISLWDGKGTHNAESVAESRTLPQTFSLEQPPRPDDQRQP